MEWFTGALLVVFVVLLLAAPSLAQLSTAQLSGRVTDETGTSCRIFRPGTEETSGEWIANFNSGTFGRITTQAGAPRIIHAPA